MKIFSKTIAAFVFVILYLVLLILGTLRFQLLNSDFIFPSLERNHTYEQIPKEFAKSLLNDPHLPLEVREDYAKLVASVPPEKIKLVFERNAASILDYIDGKANTFQISIAPSEVGFPPGVVLFWSSAQNQGSFDFLYGLNRSIFLVWLTLFVILLCFYFVLHKSIILMAGIISLLLGGMGKVALMVIVVNTPLKEPAQVLLVLVSQSLLTDIMSTWIAIGIVCIVIWLVLRTHKTPAIDRYTSKRLK